MSNYLITNALEADGENLIDEIEKELNLDTTKFVTIEDKDQTIKGTKTFESVVINNEIIHNHESFSTQDGIIHQLKNNTTNDILDYGNYATYNDGTGIKYKGIINKKEGDKFYVFHNQTNEPTISLNLSTQDLGTLVVREPIDNNEVATKAYVESHIGSYLPLSGGNVSGDINMGGGRVTNLKVIRFDDEQGLYNDILFRDTSRLSLGSYNSSTYGHRCK